MRYFYIQVLVIFLVAINFPSNCEGESSVADAFTSVARSDSTGTVADTEMFAETDLETFSPAADGASEGIAQLSHIKDNLTPAAKPVKTILSRKRAYSPTHSAAFWSNPCTYK